MTDYLVALKMDDGGLFLKAHWRLFKIYISLDYTHAYTRAMTLQSLTFMWYIKMKQKLPIFSMMRCNPNIFNEECEEISFAILGRSCLGDTQKMRLEHMNKMYKQVALYKTISDAITKDSQMGEQDDEEKEITESMAVGGHAVVKETDAIVLTADAWFREALSQMATSTFGVYDNKKCFKSAAMARMHSRYNVNGRAEIRTPRMLLLRVDKHLRVVVEWWEKKFTKRYGRDFAECFPEFGQQEQEPEARPIPSDVEEKENDDHLVDSDEDGDGVAEAGSSSRKQKKKRRKKKQAGQDKPPARKKKKRRSKQRRIQPQDSVNEAGGAASQSQEAQIASQPPAADSDEASDWMTDMDDMLHRHEQQTSAVQEKELAEMFKSHQNPVKAIFDKLLEEAGWVQGTSTTAEWNKLWNQAVQQHAMSGSGRRRRRQRVGDTWVSLD